jgi:hypothetical protein
MNVHRGQVCLAGASPSVEADGRSVIFGYFFGIGLEATKHFTHGHGWVVDAQFGKEL